MARKILVIDDDPDVLLATRLPLEREGYEVYEALDEAEGLEQAKSILPDLIILDVMMGTHTAGFQLAQELHGPDAPAVLRRIPIMMVTAVHQTTPLRFRPESDYLPVQAFLEKPLDPRRLLDEVRKLLPPEQTGE
ncbi:MAG: response regulator [Anaerolineae bacterium]|nr:response regulator [Anaerolineae bacterium]